MQPSATLVNFIKGEEGFSARPYLDPPKNKIGQKSIGYGHLIKSNESHLLNATWTKAQASNQLNVDLAYSVAMTNRAIKRPVSQQQFDALVDLCYNAGEGAMQHVTATWNATGDSIQTANHLKQFHFVTIEGVKHPDNGLIARRAKEATWFTGAIQAVEQVVEKKSLS